MNTEITKCVYKIILWNLQTSNYLKNHNTYGRNCTGNANVLHFSVQLLFKTFIASNTYLNRYAQGNEDMHRDHHLVSVISAWF